jgi:hypothetical protein
MESANLKTVDSSSCSLSGTPRNNYQASRSSMANAKFIMANAKFIMANAKLNELSFESPA